jgi:hypothetical protein
MPTKISFFPVFFCQLGTGTVLFEKHQHHFLKKKAKEV